VAELDFLLAMLPQYCETLVAEKRTLMPKFFAVVSFYYTEDGSVATDVAGAGASTGVARQNSTAGKQRRGSETQSGGTKPRRTSRGFRSASYAGLTVD
jgi:hypothetical protein